jgi:hypothetical protein
VRVPEDGIGEAVGPVDAAHGTTIEGCPVTFLPLERELDIRRRSPARAPIAAITGYVARHGRSVSIFVR